MTSSSEEFAQLDENVFNELLRLARYYKRDAEKCEQAKAYLMGCCAITSALETALICVVHLYPEDVIKAPSLPRSRSKVRPLLKWKLSHLVQVAREVGWLPAGLELDAEWNSRRAKIGDHVVAVMQLRNLVHPAAYIDAHVRKRVTARYLKHAFEVVDVAIKHLEARNAKALLKAMKEEGWTPEGSHAS